MLHYEVRGEGPRTLVCLHGFLETSVMWNALPLENYARLILVDLPGHGKSSLTGIDSMHSMALSVMEVLEKEGVSEYDVIGHSMGGYVGLELKRNDANCQQLILLNSNVWTDNKYKKEDRQRLAKLVQTKKERFISEAIPNLFRNPEKHSVAVDALIEEAKTMQPEAIARTSISMSERIDFSEAVFSQELELVVIQGEFDPMADRGRMEQIMANQLENFYVVNAGHMAHMEARESVVEILEKILRYKS